MKKDFFNKISVIGSAVILCVGLAGCGSNYAVTKDTMSYMENASATSASYDAGSVQTDDMYVTEEGAVSTKGSEQLTDNRKLIKTVDLEVETQEYDKLLTNLQDKVNSLGGYMENFSTNGYDENRYANMVARIPSDKLDGFVSEVAEMSNITYRNESVEDVTLTYVDLDSHKKMLEAEEDRLLTLMEQAETVEDMITIENSLTDVRYQIESMGSQLRTYDNQVDYSTVTIGINEVNRITPQTPKSAIERMQTGFMESLRKVGVGLQNFGINFVINLPFIILFGIILVLIFVIVKVFISIERKNMQKRQAKRIRQNQNGGYTPVSYNMPVSHVHNPTEVSSVQNNNMVTPQMQNAEHVISKEQNSNKEDNK